VGHRAVLDAVGLKIKEGVAWWKYSCYPVDLPVRRGLTLGYGLDDWDSRVRFPAGAGNFSLHHCVQNSSGAQPASYPMGTRGSFPGVKRPGREADHSPPSSSEVKE
jgi:hypothetical protein